MKGRYFLFVALIIASALFYYEITEDISTDKTTVKVTEVVDGDTIKIENGQKVRLLGINTPERSMDGYQEAKDYLKDMAENRTG